MDEELFELCKEVFERTEWDTVVEYDRAAIVNKTPLYNIECVLDRLPLQLFVQPDFAQNFILQKTQEGTIDEWKAGYPYIIEAASDTPLKAILKLTIDLHNVGEIKE